MQVSVIIPEGAPKDLIEESLKNAAVDLADALYKDWYKRGITDETIVETELKGSLTADSNVTINDVHVNKIDDDTITMAYELYFREHHWGVVYNLTLPGDVNAS